MKKFLFLTLVYLSFSAEVVDPTTLQGPAHNPKNAGSTHSCNEYKILNNGEWYDSGKIGGVSDCVDLQLWSGDKYYDHCCYIRVLSEGETYGGCIGLTEEQYLDTTETIKRLENGDKTIWEAKGYNSKVYQLDCFSKNIKGLSATILLLLALFF